MDDAELEKTNKKIELLRQQRINELIQLTPPTDNIEAIRETNTRSNKAIVNAYEKSRKLLVRR
jgi:hypothetical protein